MKRKEILIVDDQEDIIKVVKYILEDEGYIVHSALGGFEALNKLKEIKVDLILLDLVMPGLSGYELVQRIKSKQEFKDTPLIILSGKKDEVDKYFAAKSGALGYIEKPLDKDKLLYYISDILGKEDSQMGFRAKIQDFFKNRLTHKMPHKRNADVPV